MFKHSVPTQLQPSWRGNFSSRIWHLFNIFSCQSGKKLIAASSDSSTSKIPEPKDEGGAPPKIISTPASSLATQLSPITEDADQRVLSRQKKEEKPITLVPKQHHVISSDDFHSAGKRRHRQKQKQKDSLIKAVPDRDKGGEKLQASFESHTPFTAKPHPLITPEDLMMNTSEHRATNSSSSTNDRSQLYSRGGTRLSGTLGGVAKGVAKVVTPPEDEHEYYSELTHNVSRSSHHSLYQVRITCS